MTVGFGQVSPRTFRQYDRRIPMRKRIAVLDRAERTIP
jgi:hypothetical protein